MDVRGPADGHDANNLSRVRRELLRFETHEAQSGPKSQQLSRVNSHAEASTEIVQLVQQLQALPEVRAELVTQAIAKLRAGEFSTRESAEATAQAVLRTQTAE